jgi:hypothetical protein
MFHRAPGLIMILLIASGFATAQGVLAPRSGQAAPTAPGHHEVARLLHVQDAILDPGALPAQVAFEPLASVVVDPLVGSDYAAPPRPTLWLERIPLQPNANVDGGSLLIERAMQGLRDFAAGPQLLFVEQGEIVLADTIEGVERTYAEGEHLLLPVSEFVTPYDTRQLVAPGFRARNDTLRCASILVLTFASSSPQGGFTASDEGPVPPSCGSYELIFTGLDAEWPIAPATLFMARMRWSHPFAELAYTGPTGLLIESGTLEVQSQDGLSVRLDEGDGAMLPSRLRHSVRVGSLADYASASGLLVGLVPFGQSLVADVSSPGDVATVPSGVVDIALVSVDAVTLKRLAGACYIIQGASMEGCDENGDGQVDYQGVVPGTYTVTETRPPAGYRATADFFIVITGAVGEHVVPHIPNE